MRLLLLLLLVLSGGVSQASDYSFREAKVVMREQILPLHPETLYCGCPVILAGKKPYPNLEACGYQVRKQAERAARLEWEHVVPASDFGQQRQCWQQGGRKACSGKDAAFDRFEGDLHNLYPTVGEVNGDRGNFRFGMVSGPAASYGQCTMRIDFKGRVAEPPPRARGVVARTSLYIAAKHGLKLSDRQRQLFEAWDRQFPVAHWECQRNARIRQLQGDSNSYVARGCPQD